MIDFTGFCFLFFFVFCLVASLFAKRACDKIQEKKQKKLARKTIEQRKALWDANMSESERLFEGGVKR
jgi:preprotein translocase subunit SecG